MTRLGPPIWYKKLGMAAIGLLLCLEAGAMGGAIYLAGHIHETVLPELQWIGYLILTIVLLLVTTGIGMGIYIAHVVPNTSLEYDESHIELRNPFRSWSGTWALVRRAYMMERGLNIQITPDFMRTWAIIISPQTRSLRDDFRSRLPEGVWMDRVQARRYILSKMIPLIIFIAAMGLLSNYLVEKKVNPYIDKKIREFINKTLPPQAT